MGAPRSDLPLVDPSQLALSAREQSAAERVRLPVLRYLPSGYPGLFLVPPWRTLATSHGDHRLLLEITPAGCDTFLGVTVTDTPTRVRVLPLVAHNAAGSCVRQTPVVVGYVDFPQPLGARLEAASS